MQLSNSVAARPPVHSAGRRPKARGHGVVTPVWLGRKGESAMPFPLR
jgi:hypothetical protein